MRYLFGKLKMHTVRFLGGTEIKGRGQCLPVMFYFLPGSSKMTGQPSRFSILANQACENSLSKFRIQKYVAIYPSAFHPENGRLVLTHSVAILTDALESIVNVVAGLLAYIACTFLPNLPDSTNKFIRHGKIEFISAIEGTPHFVAWAY